MAVTLLSVNGRLESLYREHGVDGARSAAYQPVQIGRPLLVRYLRFSLKYREGRQRVMLSTWFKSTPEKRGECEAINYFDPAAEFDQHGRMSITDFGGQNYGHPLCYYTSAYAGQRLAMTMQMMDLNRSDSARAVVAALEGAVGQVGGVPLFIEFLPYVGMAKAGLSLLDKLVDFVSRDKPVFTNHHLDLEFDAPNTRRLQSGRLVCLPDEPSEAKFLNEAAGYRLDAANVLVDKGGWEFKDSGYFVLQVDAKHAPDYENFDYYQDAAELLGRTNRGGASAQSVIDDVVEVVRSAGDFRLIASIEGLRRGGWDEAKRMRAQAYFRLLSLSMQDLYERRFRELLGVEAVAREGGGEVGRREIVADAALLALLRSNDPHLSSHA